MYWGNLLAECAYNLRSAFDQLIYVLSQKENGGEQAIGSKMPKDIKMPIHFRAKAPLADEDKNGYLDTGRAGGKQKIRKINSTDIREAIERIQPYNSPTGNYEDHPLWVINELCNTDKHRETLPVSLRASFDYIWQAGGPPKKHKNWKWHPGHCRSCSDTEIGYFTTPNGCQIDTTGIKLIPAIEPIKHSAIGEFKIVGGPKYPGGEMSLPQDLYEFVAKFVQDIGIKMGWEEVLSRSGMLIDRNDKALPRKWLPGRPHSTFIPFVPTDSFGNSYRKW